MNCQAPLPADDDGLRRDLWRDDEPFAADDELFPVAGVTPRDAADEPGADPLWGFVLGAGAVFLVVAAAVAFVLREGAE